MSSRKMSVGKWFYLSVCLLGVAGCSSAPTSGNEPVGETTSALTVGGAIRTFGGVDNNCLQVSGSSLVVGACNGAGQQFSFDGSTIKTSSNLCVDIRFGDLGAGVVDVTTCNGTINQQWDVSGGQITSLNKSDGQQHCLDVLFGNHAVGTAIDVAPCNATQAQSFMVTGATVNLPSSFMASSRRECLDVFGDHEQPGTTLDDGVCNGTNAQRFTFDSTQRIHLANNTGLCLGFNGGVQNGASPLAVKACDASASDQKWSFLNKGHDANGRALSSIRNLNFGCLDVFGGNPANATTVETAACNGTAAQLWSPVLATAELNLRASTTQLAGDFNLCGGVNGYKPGSSIDLIMTNVPGSPSPMIFNVTTTNGTGGGSFFDSMSSTVLACTTAQLFSTVNVAAEDINSGQIALGTMPGDFFCENGGFSVFNGGC